MGLCAVHEHRAVLLVNGVDYAVLIGQPNRIESLQVTDQFLPGPGIEGNLIQNDLLEFVNQAWREALDVFQRLLCEAHFIRCHALLPKTSSKELVSPFST